MLWENISTITISFTKALTLFIQYIINITVTTHQKKVLKEYL